MNSKEALGDIRDYHNETVIDNYCTYTENMFEKQLDTIEKDLDILEEYRKIEKELGIDLLTLFKALRTGVYIKQYGEIEHYYLKLFGDGINFCLTTYVGVKVILNKYDYGKTGALTREELENDID